MSPELSLCKSFARDSSVLDRLEHCDPRTQETLTLRWCISVMQHSLLELPAERSGLACWRHNGHVIISNGEKAANTLNKCVSEPLTLSSALASNENVQRLLTCSRSIARYTC